MSRACLLLCLAVAVFNLAAANLEITEFAVPSSVKAGENAELQCRYAEHDQPGAIKWWRRPLPGGGGDARTVQLYQRIAGRHAEILHERVTVVTDGDAIVLMHMQPSDSAVYECEMEDRQLNEMRKRHELIVYTPGHGVTLNVSKVPDGPDADADEDARVECEAQGVAPEPELLLIIDGIHQSLRPQIIRLQDGLYDIVANVTVSRDAVDGKQVICELFYKNKNVTHGPYTAKIEEFDWSGGEPATSEGPEVTTQSNSTAEQPLPGGAPGLGSSCLLMLAAAAAQLRLAALL